MLQVLILLPNGRQNVGEPFVLLLRMRWKIGKYQRISRETRRNGMPSQLILYPSDVRGLNSNNGACTELLLTDNRLEHRMLFEQVVEDSRLIFGLPP